MNNLDLFFHCFTKGHDALKEIVIQVLTDTIITHPQLLAPPPVDPDATAEDAEPKPNPLIKPTTKVLLKAFASDNKRISLIACTAASKLLLLGILPPNPTSDILRAFTLTYFDPEAASHPALRQALSYFLPVFCHSKLKNAQLMAQIAVPLMSKLLLMREESIEEEDAEDMVGWPVITAHLSEWTDGRKVVGATELGLDGKTSTTAEAEEPHIHLAVEVLERALTSTCSKDERKPLLSLLSKLYIAPSSASINDGGGKMDEESLRTLHGLVAEAVEGKIGTDATQRNALSKLEMSLVKRLGEVEHITQVQDPTSVSPNPTTVEGNDAENEAEVDATEAPEPQGGVDGSELEDEEEEDTMFAGMQGEGTRMPLEDDEEDDVEETTMTIRGGRPVVTEDDIMESLLRDEDSA